MNRATLVNIPREVGGQAGGSRCVDDVQGNESFKTRPWLSPESSALESSGFLDENGPKHLR